MLKALQFLKAQDSADGQQVSPDLAKIKQDAEAQKAVAEAQKAAAEAQKSEAEAKLAAMKASIGEVPTSGYTGGVELKEKAGATEAALLAAKAITQATSTVATVISPKVEKTILLYAAADVPNFQALIAFRAQVAIVKKSFENAKAASDKADETAPGPRAIAPIPGGAGLALEAVNQLLGFFRTDYAIGGVELSLEDSLLLHALAGCLAEKGKQVQLPAVYNPGALLPNASTGITEELTDLASSKNEAQNTASRHEKVAAAFTSQAEKEPDLRKKEQLQKNAAIHKSAADAAKAAVTLHDAFFNKLTTADDKGIVPLTSVIRDQPVAKGLLDGNYLLVTKLQKSGGGYYTKKNMWTLFGGMPLYHMGGVVVSYVLLNGKDGTVLVSGVVPVHGGFVKATNLQKWVNDDGTGQNKTGRDEKKPK